MCTRRDEREAEFFAGSLLKARAIDRIDGGSVIARNGGYHTSELGNSLTGAAEFARK